MKNFPITFSYRHLAILGALGLLLLGSYLTAKVIVSERLESLEFAIRSQLSAQQATLVAIVEATARGGADAVTESIVRDCTLPERSEFDTLLGRLNSGLSRTELVTLERLFGRCGSFYADRKAVMSARLTREIEVYEAYVTQLSMVHGEDVSATFVVGRWKELAAEEEKQSQLFGELVLAQDKIISTLLSGSSATSPEMAEILEEARQIQETLFVANKQSAALRGELIPL